MGALRGAEVQSVHRALTGGLLGPLMATASHHPLHCPGWVQQHQGPKPPWWVCGLSKQTKRNPAHFTMQNAVCHAAWVLSAGSQQDVG